MSTVAIILGMLVLPVFPQDEPPSTPEDTREVPDGIADLMKRAEQGDAYAQYLVRWYRGATEQGGRLAQFYLGFMYSKGQGVPQDYKEAVRWSQAAAEQGSVSAQYNLGNFYRDGKGVPQDYQEAMRWLRAAAEQGHSSAQNNLGVMYDKGQGVPQDYIQAHMWFNLAASSRGDEDGESAVKNRDLIAKKMTSEQIAEAQRLAREWKPKTGSQ